MGIVALSLIHFTVVHAAGAVLKACSFRAAPCMSSLVSVSVLVAVWSGEAAGVVTLGLSVGLVHWATAEHDPFGREVEKAEKEIVVGKDGRAVVIACMKDYVGLSAIRLRNKLDCLLLD